MKRARLRGMQDYLALIVRRRGCVAGGFVAVFALAFLFALLFPKVYRSETMILIQPRDVPTDFVKDLIAGTTDQRLQSIEKTVLSRTNLMKILNEFETRMPRYRGLNDDRKVAKLRTQIKIDFVSERRNGVYLPTTNFTISYKDRDPDLAQKVTAQLATLFIQQDSAAREQQVFGTTEFLNAELNKVAENLRQSEARLKSLKERYRYELPGELDTNLRTLDRLQLQKTSNGEALDRHISLLMTLERQLSETPPMLIREPAGRPGAPAAAAPDPRVEEYRKKEADYKALLVKYSEKHPDVAHLKEELDRLRKEIPPEDFARSVQTVEEQQAAVMVPNPVYQNLMSQLSQVKTEMDIREKEKKNIEAEMVRYNERIQNTPGVEASMAAEMRVNGDLNRQHQDLKGKLEQAKLAESLESHQKGSQFVPLDPANYPMEPITPSRRLILLGGAAISLVIGIVIAWIVEFFNQRIWTQRELERLLEGPVLIEIPRLVSPRDVVRRRWRLAARAAAFLVASGVYAAGLYYLYLKQTTLVRLLDPIFEKLTDRLAS